MARFTTMSRRTILRGTGGAALALPMLEIMMPKRASAAAAAVPKRFVMLGAGIGLGVDKKPLTLIIPSKTGANYSLTRALSPLGEATYIGDVRGNVRGDMGMISGLRIPVSTGSSAASGTAST